MKYIKILFFFSIAVLPFVVKRLVYTLFLGYKIHPSARIGLSYLQVKHLSLGPNARIGHLNIIRGLELLEMGERSSIGNSNRVSALDLRSKRHFQHQPDRLPALKIGPHSAITGKHYLDCNDTIEIGHHSIVAGLGTAFFTHGINLQESRQEAKKIIVGNYCMVSARCVVIKGAVLPNNSILGANSTLHKAYDQTFMLYSGVPASPVRQLDESYRYFHRDIGDIG